MLSSADDYARTRPLFERALESQEKFLGPDHPEVAESVTNLAHVLSRIGEVDLAGPLYERALQTWEKTLGPGHPKVATALVNLARHHLRIGTYHGVEALLTRALVIQEKGLGPEHPDVAVTLSARADLSARTGATVEAFGFAVRAEAIGRERLRLTVRTLPERQALAYASLLPSTLDLMLSLLSRRPADRHMVTEAFDAVIRSRGLMFDEVAARQSVASVSEAREISDLAEALASARQRLAALTVRGIRNDPPDRYRRLLEHARAADRAERDLAEKSAQYRDDQSRAALVSGGVAAAMPSRAALVSFVKYRNHSQGPATTDAAPRRAPESSYLAFILHASNSEPVMVPLGTAAKVDGLILQWRNQLDQEALAAGRTTGRGEAAYRRVAGELRRQIWDPLVPHLFDSARVFVIPDGALHLVSFGALPTEGTRYLVETGPLMHYLSAERDLVPPQAVPPTGQGLLAVGGPAFDDVTPPLRVQPAAPFRGAPSACPEFQSLKFDPLPASVEEVREVARLWERARATGGQAAPVTSSPATVRLTGAAANESASRRKQPAVVFSTWRPTASFWAEAARRRWRRRRIRRLPEPRRESPERTPCCCRV